MNSFVTIDFETANGSLASICQVGIAVFEDGIEVETYSSLVNPEDSFWGMNIAIHGITPEMVASEPTFPDIYEQIKIRLAGRLVISHGWFDKNCMSQVLGKYDLPNFETKWLDSTLVVKRAIPEFSKSGYGLQNVASHYGISTIAHEALNDAQTCGIIILKILRNTNTTIDQWLNLTKQPLAPKVSNSIQVRNLIINENGPYVGESLVFTGSLSMERNAAQQIAASVGFQVQNNVTKKTNYLVCGVQDLSLLAGHELSSKERKARELIAQGQRIRLLCETDFFKMCEGNL
jgi:DNA polymerase-3 subunit epsilon